MKIAIDDKYHYLTNSPPICDILKLRNVKVIVNSASCFHVCFGPIYYIWEPGRDNIKYKSYNTRSNPTRSKTIRLRTFQMRNRTKVSFPMPSVYWSFPASFESPSSFNEMDRSYRLISTRFSSSLLPWVGIALSFL